MKYDISFTIFARELKAAALFASTDAVRYIMNAVCVEVWPDGRVLLIATDGRVLAFIRAGICEITGMPELPEGDCIKVIIPLKTIADIRGNGMRSLRVRLHCDGVTVPEVSITEEFSDITKTSKVVDGTYPNTRHVIMSPEPESNRLTFVAPARMAVFAKAIEALNGKNCGMLISSSGNGDDPPCIITVPERYGNFYGILMPLRVGNNAINLSICPTSPHWV